MGLSDRETGNMIAAEQRLTTVSPASTPSSWGNVNELDDDVS